MTKRPFNAKGRRAQDLLELVHSNICGPMSTQARGGYEYFITFTDDYSRFGCVPNGTEVQSLWKVQSV